jgi:hypothetical protein
VNLKRSERHCGSCSNRCAEGEECVGGVCQGGGCPTGGTPLQEGECHCGVTCGADSTKFACRDNPNGPCVCVETAEGTGFCAFFGFVCSNLVPCTSSSDCPTNYQCAVSLCCDTPVCFPPCSSVTSGVGQSPASRESGLTEVGPRGG